MKKAILFTSLVVMVFPQMANAGSIKGTVTDSNNNPMQWIWVWANDYGTGGYAPVGGDHTDANGVYEITDLPAGTYRLEANTWQTDYIRQFYDHQAWWESATPVTIAAEEQKENVNFNLSIGASISGFVKNSDGNGVEDVKVNCFVDGIYYAHDVTTEPNGFYRARGLLPGYTYRVAAFPPSTTEYMITRIYVNAPEVNDYNAPDIVLQTGALTVSGRVTDKQTSLPLENIRIDCCHDDEDFWLETRTDVNGLYALTNLPPGWVEISARPESYYASIGVEFELTEDVNDMDFALPPEATLSGKVLDIETAQPLAGIKVEYWSERYFVWQNDYTDVDGTFTLTNLPPGIAEIKAMPDVDTGYAWNLPWGSNWICLAEGEHRSGRIITLQKGALVTGYIKDSNGIPLSNIEYDWGGRMCEGWAYNGHYEIRLPLGTYTIGLDEDGFGALHQKVTITDVNIPVDVNDITVYSEQPGSQISGNVNNPGGHPKTGEFIVAALEAGTVVDPNTWYTYTAWPVRETESEQAGPFVITALPPDANYDVYLLVISENHDEIESVAVRDSVFNVPIGTTGINLNYSSEGSTVTGSVVNIDGQAVLGAAVLLNDPCTGALTGSADVNENGEYVIYNVPAGTYAATAVHSKYLNTSTPVQVVDGVPADVNTIVMPFAGEKEATDLNGDGFVDTFDLAEFTDQWLQSGSLEADFSQDNNVNFVDWTRLAENWLWQAIWYHD